MSSRAEIVEYLVEQLGAQVTARAMFGEYGLYRAGTLIGLVCDDRLFLKPTAAARALLGEPEEAPPYPGAKPSLVVPEERWDDGELLAALARVTAEGLLPKSAPHKPKAATKAPSPRAAKTRSASASSPRSPRKPKAAKARVKRRRR